MSLQPDTRRRSARIHYPAHLAPEVELGHVRYTVVDLSEDGCLLAVPVPEHYHLGEHVRGTLRFRDGAILPLEAHVLRTANNGFVLEFVHAVPVGYIHREAAMFGSEERDRRRFFRLRYPEKPYPQLVCRGVQYDVVEVSEAGIVLFSPGLSSFMKGQQIFGSLIFHDRASIPIAGSVYRMSTTEVTVLLARFIPTERMIKEQQYVQQMHRRG